MGKWKTFGCLTFMGLWFLFLATGCMSPWGMNQDTQQKSEIDESKGTQAVAETETKFKGVPGTVGDIKVEKTKGNVELHLPPASMQPTELEQSERKAASSEATFSGKTEAWFKQRSPFTLIFIGVGLVAVVYGLKKLWDLVKNTAAGNALKLADEKVKAQIDTLRARMATEADPAKLTALKDALVDAEAAAWK